ncbi:uncharacterized protein BP5553_10409 [Venustampulla echinocandica]|uniref:Uncharacterized protein n=1 Tax=Venustampulla echinocandica TaxID=2656787 RepID=A0A370T986_9HELO|nr:uncharacterized protein BP5553_10409 [Venustampulla echinocandica]RDL30131.1 hypothetical protein BP5553_10409 [Venustampulla echinocandica]
MRSPIYLLPAAFACVAAIDGSSKSADVPSSTSNTSLPSIRLTTGSSEPTSTSLIYSNTTTSSSSTVAPSYVTSVVVVGGTTTSVVVVGGDTTSFGPAVTPTGSLQPGSGGERSVAGVGFGAWFAVALAVVFA